MTRATGALPLSCTPERLARSFREGQHDGSNIQGIVGRILRGAPSQCKGAPFETLSNDPARKVVQLIDHEGLQPLIGLDTTSLLLKIGYTKDYIKDLISGPDIHAFKFVFMPAHDGAQRSYWEETLAIVQEAWPNIPADLTRYANVMRKTGFPDFEAQLQKICGMTFKQVKAAGITHPMYVENLALERMGTNPTPLAVRIFLYLSAYLTELYSGNGFTYEHYPYNGMILERRGLPEYIMHNVPIASLNDAVVIDLPNPIL